MIRTLQFSSQISSTFHLAELITRTWEKAAPLRPNKIIDAVNIISLTHPLIDTLARGLRTV